MSSAVRLLIAYDSWTGHCDEVARHVEAGATEAGATVVRKHCADVVRHDFKDLDALIIGSPVHQRGMSWPVKKFIDEICEPAWFYDEMVGRAGAVFTTGGGHGDAGAGAEMAQLSMLANLASMGCVLVPFPKITRGFDVAGTHWGPHVRITHAEMQPLAPDDLSCEALTGAANHGAAVARIASALKAESAERSLVEHGGLFPSARLLRERSGRDASGAAQGCPR